MKRRISPCYNCDRRALGCHGICEDYKAYTAENIAINEKRREILDKNNVINGVEFGVKEKLIKRNRRHK